MHSPIMDEKEQPTTTSHHMESGTDFKSPVTSAAEDEGDFKFTFGKFMAFLSFQLGYFSDTLVVSMVSAALVPINRAVGPSPHYVWIITAQIVGGTAIAPIIGRLGDIFGRRNFLLAGNSLAIVGTIVSATANNVNTLIGGGVLIGIASSMRQLAWAALGELVPKRSRGLAFGILQSSLSVAPAFGPLIAYACLKDGTWRPVYWIPFALDTSSLVLVFFFYHPINQYIHEVGKSRWDQLKRMDFIGSALFIAGIVLFLLGISFGGNQYPWRSAGTIAPIVVGFVLLILLGVYEAHAKILYPIFPPNIFRDIRGFTVLQIGTFLVGMLFYSTAVLWPLQVSTLYATDPITIGWYSSAGGIGGVIFGPFLGLLQQNTRYSHRLLPLIVFLLTVVTGAQAIVTPTSNVGSTALLPIVYAFIAGASVFATAMIQLGVEHAYIGIASGVLVTARGLGGSVATTIYLSILQNKVAGSLAADVGAPLAEAGVPLKSIPAIIEALAAGDTTSPALASISPAALYAAVLGLKTAYAHAFRVVYLVSIAFGVVGTIVVAFAKSVESQMTRKVDIKLDEGAHIHSNMDTGEGHVVHVENDKVILDH